MLFAAVNPTTAFSPVAPVTRVPSTTVSTTTSLNVFGKKKSAAQKAEDAAKAEMYWQGEWVCKDCGYIYNRVRAQITNNSLEKLLNSHEHFLIYPFHEIIQSEVADMYFEEQGTGFRCPQCSGPRRRYAKKVGDVVGTTLDGGDAPILIFSFGGVIATIIFGIWAVDNL